MKLFTYGRDYILGLLCSICRFREYSACVSILLRRAVLEIYSFLFYIIMITVKY